MLELLVQNLIQALVLVLVAVLVGFLSRFALVAVRYIKAKMTAEQFAMAKSFATTVVRFVEQSSAWDDALKDGTAKKERALLEMSTWATERNIPLTFELADKIIEEAVNVMKSEFAEVGKEIAG